MSLEHAILGFLNYHPYSGYDLKKIFDTSVQHFWPADQSQIYRTLRSLTEAGWVDMEKVPQEDRPDRKVYHITRKGRTELMGWLAGPPPLEGTRSAGLIQVFFAGQLPDEEIIKKFEEFAVQIRGVLALYESIPKQIEPYRQEIASSREYFFWMVTLDSGIRSMHASLEWAESVIKKLKMGMAPEK